MAGSMLGFLLFAHLGLHLGAKTSWLQHWAASYVASVYQGKVVFEQIRPALLPLPHAIVYRGRLEGSETFSLRFDQLILYPKIRPLLSLKLRLGQIKLIAPDIVLHASPKQTTLEEKSLLAAIRPDPKKISEFLANSAQGILPNKVKVRRGHLKWIGADKKSTIKVRDVSATVILTSGDLQLDFKGKPSMADQIVFEGQWNLKSLRGGGHLDMDALRIDQLITQPFVLKSYPIPKMSLDVSIDFSNHGFESVQLEFQGRAPSVKIQNGVAPVLIRELAFKGSGQWSDQKMHIQVTHIRTKAPQIDLNGHATWVDKERFEPIPTELFINAGYLNLAELRAGLLSLFGKSSAVKAFFKIVQGGVIPSWTVMLKPPASGKTSVMDRLQMAIRLQNGKIVLPDDLMTIESVKGTVMWSDGRIIAQNLEGRSADTMARNGNLIWGLLDGSREFRLDTDIEADLVWVSEKLKKRVHDDTVQAFINALPKVRGRAIGHLQLGDHLDQLRAGIRLVAGSHLATLDSNANITGTIDHLPSPEMTMDLSIQGHLGTELMEWIENRYTTAKTYLPRAPIDIRHARITGNPVNTMALDSGFIVHKNLVISTALMIEKRTFHLLKMHLKDPLSDAGIALTRSQADRSWQADFTGTLNGATLESLFQNPHPHIGQIQGHLKVGVDPAELRHTSIQGDLALEGIEIPLRNSPPLCIEKASLFGTENRFVLEDTVISWHDETAQISGEGVFEPSAIRLDLELHAGDLNADNLLERLDARKSSGDQMPSMPDGLNLVGNIYLAIDRLAIVGHRFSPVRAVVSMNPDQTVVEVKTAELCGISVPGRILFKDDNIQLAFKPHANQTVLSDTGQCFYGLDVTERLEGQVTLDGDISSSGESRDELIQNLSGHFVLNILDGRVYNVGTAGTITNLLSYLSLNQLANDGVPDLRTDDFPYNSLTSRLSLKKGVLNLEEGVLKSNSVNIVASGKLLLKNRSLDLVLLVSPLTTVDWIVGHLPIVGHILEGTLIALPVGIKGSIKNPDVLPLSPDAIGSRLGGILKRTLKTPFRIIEPLIKQK